VKHLLEFRSKYHPLLAQNEIRGVTPSLAALLFALIEPEPVKLLVVPDLEKADLFLNDLKAWEHQPPAFFGQKCPPGIDRGQSSRALRDLLAGAQGSYLTTFEDIVRPIDAKAFRRLSFIVGEEYNFPELQRQLVDFGYEKVSLVTTPGTFAVRGGIIDVFPEEADAPYRLDFWGDRLEALRLFSPVSQRSLQNISHLVLYPTSPLENTSGNTSALALLPSELKVVLFDPPSTLPSFPKSLAGRIQLFHSSPESNPDLEVEDQPAFKRNLEAFKAHLRWLLDKGYECWLCAESQVQLERLAKLMGPLPYRPLRLALSKGFIDHTHHVALFTDHQIFERPRARNILPRWFPSQPVPRVEDFQEGDYVVHLDYGIGIYEGIELIKVAGEKREVLSIRYQEGDHVYVPVDKMHRVHKYNSPPGLKPKITRLRSAEWQLTRLRTKRAVEKYSQWLVELYARRANAKGHAFPPDSELQVKMEAAFPYEETPDQLRAWEEIKRDMEAPRPMERLLCGAVGYGKTEIAIRAAFKAVSDSKQVAVLVPTTVLAEQHYATFRQRLEDFPVTVAALSRLRKPSEIQRILQDLKSGRLDILIGTHKMLSKQVVFKNLGLLIIDEEHRFGVRQKELLKDLKQNVDCLTLTATPIPRTLQMSLLGIRDYSLLRTAPRERRPVITQVAEYSDKLVREAVLRELDRQGQIFFIHNRVESIGLIYERLRYLLPDVRMALAHGQMPPRELERVMLGFFNHEFDLLLSTTIVESGLDVPNANTLIVNWAENLGLSQLYQLRGRVGRSNRTAWALFLTAPHNKLSPDALKRLHALQRFAHYGGGYELALQDLEIRGAGNLFGPEQSGHIARVGHHLYSKIRKEALEELKGQESKPTLPPVELEHDLSVSLPRDYVSDPQERVSFYRRLAHAESRSEIEELKEELRDRFGRLPALAEDLFELATVKLLANQLQLRKLIIKSNRAQGDFHPQRVEQEGPKIIKGLSLAAQASGLKMELMNNLVLTFILSSPPTQPLLKRLRIFLENIPASVN